jgi:hypothetical protein
VRKARFGGSKTGPKGIDEVPLLPMPGRERRNTSPVRIVDPATGIEMQTNPQFPELQRGDTADLEMPLASVMNRLL